MPEKPECCVYGGRYGGPCWGAVTRVDPVRLDEEVLCACEGHRNTWRGDDYIKQPAVLALAELARD